MYRRMESMGLIPLDPRLRGDDDNRVNQVFHIDLWKI